MVGGMEKVSYALIKELSKKIKLTSLTWGGSQKYLPILLPYFFLKSLFIIPRKHITNIHLGDGLLAPLGLILKYIFNVRCTVTVHGLDVTYMLLPYQLVVPWSISKMDKVICVSDATKDECIKRGIAKEKCVVIPNGVYPNDYSIKTDKKDLENIVKTNLENKKVIVTVGRLVQRKGVYWFIKNVFLKLNKNYIYLVIGDGPDKEKIKELINSLKLNERILMLGKLSDQNLKIIYNTTDLMVLPNIKVKGDIEGFGIVAIEASSTGLPVIASSIEGLKDAVVNGKNGYLVSPDSESFIKILNSEINLNKVLIKRFINDNYSWEKITDYYFEILKNI